jgi:RHS repeat-associated protein
MLQNNNSFFQGLPRFSSVKKCTYHAPFGCELKGRNLKKSGLNKSFRFGFQGQEGDDEIKGDGNSYDFGARMYDPRLGRFFKLDPKAASFASRSPYIISSNSPIIFYDENGEYSVATHFIMTYHAALKLGFSEEFAIKVAHYASVYADHPDWSHSEYLPNDMLDLNISEMLIAGVSPMHLMYDEEKYGSYKSLNLSQSSVRISSVTIHAMKTYWEEISDEEAVDRALYGGNFKGLEGQDVYIEGAYNVIERLKGSGENLSVQELKDLGVALHTIQDAKVHQGARWVTEDHEAEADALGHENEHPNGGCVLLKTNEMEARDATSKALIEIKPSVVDSKSKDE